MKEYLERKHGYCAVGTMVKAEYQNRTLAHCPSLSLCLSRSIRAPASSILAPFPSGKWETCENDSRAFWPIEARKKKKKFKSSRKHFRYHGPPGTTSELHPSSDTHTRRAPGPERRPGQAGGVCATPSPLPQRESSGKVSGPAWVGCPSA